MFCLKISYTLHHRRIRGTLGKFRKNRNTRNTSTIFPNSLIPDVSDNHRVVTIEPVAPRTMPMQRRPHPIILANSLSAVQNLS